MSDTTPSLPTMQGEITGIEALKVLTYRDKRALANALWATPYEYVCEYCEQIHLYCKVCMAWKGFVIGGPILNGCAEFDTLEEFKKHFIEVHLS